MSATILVVDDEKNIRTTLQRSLELEGYRCETAENVRTALEVFQAMICDVALLDVQLDWATLVTDLLDRPYIYLGMAALLILGALAATSTKEMMRRMGGRNWNRLHSLVYVAAVLGVVHFAMAQKRDITAPLEYGAVLAVLLSWRLVQWIRQRRPALAAS